MNFLGKFRAPGSLGVNFRPRSGLVVHAGLLLLALLPLGARADRVVLHQPVEAAGAEAPVELLDHVEDALAKALRELGHEVLFEHGIADVPPPADTNEMRAIADFHAGRYLVVPHVRPIDVGYALDVEVFYAPKTRLERLEVEVHRERESERLREVIFSMVNERGVDDARETLEGPDRVARALAAEEAKKAEEEATHVDEPEVPPEDAVEDAAPERGPVEATQAAAPPEAAPLAPTMVQAALGVRPIALHDERATGGVIGAITLRGGRAIAAYPQLEIRGALEVGFGAAGSASVLVGGAHLTPVGSKGLFRIGGSLEAGLYGATTGDTGPAFAGRLALVADVRLKGPFRLEVGLPEVQYVSTGRGALTLGGYVGATARF
jgi:hypothetical protein